MFYEKLIVLCAQHNTTPNAVCNALGLAESAATRWRSGSIPRDTTLKKIANFFGITVDELLGNEKKEQPTLSAPNLSPEEMLLLQQWRNHPDAQPFVRKLLDMPEPQSEDGAVS